MRQIPGGRLLLYGSLLATLAIPYSNALAGSKTVCEWNLSVEMNPDGTFNEDETKTVPCEVDKSYRTWKRTHRKELTDEAEGFREIRYFPDNGERQYTEIWLVGTGGENSKLKALITPKGVYRFPELRK